jgi:hypothetical protein
MHISEQQSRLILNTRSFFGVLHVYEYNKGARKPQDDWYHELKPIIWTDDFSNLFEVVEW